MKITKKSAITFVCYMLLYGIAFCLICLIMDLVLGDPTPWQSYLAQGAIFGIIMAFVQKWQDQLKQQKKLAKKSRKKNKKQ